MSSEYLRKIKCKNKLKTQMCRLSKRIISADEELKNDVSNQAR